MWPFDRKSNESKSVTLGAGVTELGLSRATASFQSADPKRLMREGFDANTTVYACVMGWARAYSGLTWYLVRKPRAGGRVKRLYTFATAAKALNTSLAAKLDCGAAEIEDHPVLKLKERPNKFLSGTAFDEAECAYLMTTGNTYRERARARDGRVIQLFQPQPDRMRVVKDAKAFIGGYTFDPGNGQEPIELSLDEIDHIKLFGGTDPYYGRSPLAVASRSVDCDNEAMRWAYGLVLNDMRPTGAFVSKESLSDPSFQRLKQQIKEKSGFRGAGKPLVLDNGLTWVRFTMTPAEADWLQSSDHWFDNICTAYNYGKELLARGSSATYANRREALKAHYTENILPLAAKLRDVWNTRVVDTYGENLYLDFDRDQIEALQEDREKLWSRIDASKELTMNEKREAKGYPSLGVTGDVVLVSAADVPLDVAASAEVPAPAIEGTVVQPQRALPASTLEDADETAPSAAAAKAIAKLRESLVPSE